MTTFQKIEKKIAKFPSKLLKNIDNYINGMIIKPKKNKKKSEGYDFKWEGALKHLKSKYTSVQLQKEINKMR
jgi:hypothetical protein